MVDGDSDEDVVGNDDVGGSVDVGSVDGGDDPHGLRFFRCHCRGDGSFSGVAIMMLLLSSLLLSCCRCCCHCHCRRRARPLSSGRVASMVVSETKDDDDGSAMLLLCCCCDGVVVVVGAGELLETYRSLRPDNRGTPQFKLGELLGVISL